jgi:hypothetical protein
MRAGGIVPAAVVSIGMNFGRWSAAMSVPLYPETVLCDERASIGCARVMRGIESIENAVTRRSASARTRSPFTSGCRNAIRIWPSPSRPTSSALGCCTFATASAPANASATTFAPLAS